MPNVWEKDNHSGFKGMALTRGYIRFFEPDVYVEAKPGLAAECGINKDSGSPLFKRVVTLEDFVTYKDGRAPEFAFGLNILDVYRELYLKEYRFESKHPRQVVLFEGSGPDGTFAEALSGAFPEDEGLSFIRRGFLDTFDRKQRRSAQETGPAPFNREPEIRSHSQAMGSIGNQVALGTYVCLLLTPAIRTT